MNNKTPEIDPNITNPNNPSVNQAAVDPSNTSSIGQKVEQGVIDIKEGISDQSGEWEDEQERGIRNSSNIKSEAESYIRNPSPEDNGYSNKE